MADSIGSFTFLSLDGPVEGPSEQLVVVARAGVDGVAVWQSGRRGREFVLRSAKDFATQAAAATEFEGYQALQGGNPVAMEWKGLTLSASHRLLVERVERLQQEPIVGGIGGVASPRVLLICLWTCRLVEVD